MKKVCIVGAGAIGGFLGTKLAAAGHADVSALARGDTLRALRQNGWTAKLGAFKSSMLQDVEAGRAIELDSIVTAVQEIGQHLGIRTPNIDALLGLARLFGRVHGLYPEAS